ncbi:complex I intermediate-associated protein 30 (CIA30) [Alteromonadaceae bacterium 2753L.S.0a.02]|nr:complex I intermediate-associated protein 30 (CIA30) [Alteromonadaceae bacterium 2753L.S.0a.02]
MKTHHLTQTLITIIAFCTLSAFSLAEPLKPLVDDFGDAANNSLGIPRQFINDTVTGGGTNTQQQVAAGVLKVKGEIVPPRGQPGWASSVLLLDPQGLPQDASGFDGIKLLVKVNKGFISLSANSSEVKNFDYHAAPITTKADGKFHEVKIPFATMKRAWSEQTALNTKTIASLSIVAFSPQKASFEFEVDEISFYKAAAK